MISLDRDTLFLLAPGFEDNDRREYCPECAEIWGVLHYYPAILKALDIVYQPIARPRPELSRLIGEENQNCPTLVLLDSAGAAESATIKSANGVSILDNAKDIGKYFAHRYGTAFPRGD